MDFDGASWDSSLGEASPVVCCGVRAFALVESVSWKLTMDEQSA